MNEPRRHFLVGRDTNACGARVGSFSTRDPRDVTCRKCMPTAKRDDDAWNGVPFRVPRTGPKEIDAVVARCREVLAEEPRADDPTPVALHAVGMRSLAREVLDLLGLWPPRS